MAEKHFLRIKNSCGITTTVWVVVMLQFLLTVSCSREKEVVEVAFDPETTYTMKTIDMASLISDSGLTRYRMNAKEWLVFSKAREPFWYFPAGIYVEKFDTLFQAEASIKADTAYYFTQKELWHLINRVEVVNLEGKRFETSEMFWDQKTQKIYSDKPSLVIEKEDSMLGLYGFEANQDMTEVRMFKFQARFDLQEEKDSTTRLDSVGLKVR